MRMTKKITSIVLAVMMVVSMVSVMAVTTASAANVAKIGDTNYESLEAAFAAAQDGDTITLLADSAGNGIFVSPNTFNGTGLTVDFAGHTYTIDATLVGSPNTQTQAFHLEKDNKITLKNGTIYSEKALMLVQNYCDLTVDNMILTPNHPTKTNYYTLSNNNGNVVINNTTINANPTTGSFAFDACRYSSYPSVSVTVTGDSKINGDVEVTASGNDVKDGLSLNLVSGTMAGEVKISSAVQAAIDADPDSQFTTNTTTFETVSPVAEIGAAKFATLEDAWNAAQDGATITVLEDSTGDGIVAPQGKFGTDGLTVDFNGHTYTVNANTVGSAGTETNGFQLLKDNKITFKDGTITSTKAKILIQNYSDLTVENMNLTLNNPNYAYAYTLSNNNGDVVIDGSSITANNGGGYAFDVCRYASYPSVNVTVKGNSTINGNVEVYASGSDPKDGFSLTLESGTMNGDIVMDQTAQNVIDTASDKIKVTKKSTFDQAAPENFVWKDNGNGTQSLVLDNPLVPDMITADAAKAQDGNEFGITSKYLKGTLLGVQKKEAMIDDIPGSDVTSESHQEGAKNIRFVAVLDTDLIQAMQGADDYGFVLAKVSADKTYSDKIENIKYGMESAKTISAKDTYNNVCGTGDYSAYGDPTDDTTDYKYITCAVNNIDDTSKIVARFYYKKGDKVYYAKYAGHNYQYTGCISTANATA